jgi:hypothetical protein
MLSKLQLQNVCLVYDPSDKCMFLKEDDLQYGVYHCMKHRPIEKAKIEKQVKLFLADCKKKGIDPAQQGAGLGDNCSGYPVMKHKEQGYDK